MSIPFKILILGSGSAIPRRNKNHTAQLAIFNGQYLLFDCGEGTQIQLKKYGASIQKINAIFITHMHGDHYLGLPGLIFTMNLLGRQKDLVIVGPAGLKELIDFSFAQAKAKSAFLIKYVYTYSTEKKVVFEKGQVCIESFPLKHKIPTTGFLMTVGSKIKRLDPIALEKYKVPRQLRKGIAEGKDFVDEKGMVVDHQLLTLEPVLPRKFAFCTDTAFFDQLPDFIKGADLIYHETTFLNSDAQLAKEKKHSTAEQAAEIAKRAEAKRLLIGHFSNKYEDDGQFLSEARTVFTQTEIAIEGQYYEL